MARQMTSSDCGAPKPSSRGRRSGHLELRGHDDAWTATIAGISAPLKRDGDWLRADLGTGEVRFRPDRHEAFWLQSGGKVADTAYAMPLAFARR